MAKDLKSARIAVISELDEPTPGSFDDLDLADIEEEALNQHLPNIPTSVDDVPDLNPTLSEPTQTNPDIDCSLVHVSNLKNTLNFIEAIRNATLDNGNYPPHIIERLRDPPKCPVDLDQDPDLRLSLDQDPDLRLSLDLFLSTSRASEKTYHSTRAAFLRRHPEDKILSLDGIRRRVEQITRVISVVDDMCKNSCLAFTSPFSDYDQCPTCDEPRYDPILL
ncbi:hypothetical protein QCA50_017764 [Cerrena zonata]|uniref:Uncharacterized protein n=1 Tax=Cerrena zonata TaxID=2478898 RepID=A0AAW0FP87_9APHY